MKKLRKPAELPRESLADGNRVVDRDNWREPELKVGREDTRPRAVP